MSGKPNLEIHELIRAETQESELESDMGTASGHLVERSIIVKAYLFPSDWGRGPTMSTCICPNRRLGWGNEEMPDSVCRLTFAF